MGQLTVQGHLGLPLSSYWWKEKARVQEWCQTKGGASNFMSLAYRRARLLKLRAAEGRQRRAVHEFLVVFNCPEAIPIVVSDPKIASMANL